MVTEQVYSNIWDENISDHLDISPIWKECFKDEDKPENVKYRYTIKFEGVLPVQVTKITKLGTTFNNQN